MDRRRPKAAGGAEEARQQDGAEPGRKAASLKLEAPERGTF
jgi:hypothetical protein